MTEYLTSFYSNMNQTPRIGIIMGSQSDWPTLEHTANTLSEFGVPWEAKVVSAHRTPKLLYSYSETAAERGLQCNPPSPPFQFLPCQ